MSSVLGRRSKTVYLQMTYSCAQNTLKNTHKETHMYTPIRINHKFCKFQKTGSIYKNKIHCYILIAKDIQSKYTYYMYTCY